MYCEIYFMFIVCLPRRSLCVSEALDFHKDILKYLCLNYSHVSSSLLGLRTDVVRTCSIPYVFYV